METIEAAVLLAASHHATLVPLSLVPVPQARGKGARLEHIQQSKDFLEATQQKALRHSVPLERFEAFTGDAVQSIATLVQQLACDGMILALRGRNGSLLSLKMIERIMAISPGPLYLIYLPSNEPSWMSRLRERFSRRQPGHRRSADKHIQLQPVLEEQGTREVALTRHAGSPDLERRS